MNRRKHIALASIALLLVALAFAVPVAAKAARTAFAGTWTPAVIPGDLEREWYPGGRLQSRGGQLFTTLETGDSRVDGALAMLFDDHFDPEGAGRWNGAFHLEVMCDDTSGGSTPGFWDGTFTGECYGLYGYYGGIAHGRGHGSGCVEGMMIFFDMENVVSGTYPNGVENRSLKGYIHDPHGD